MSTVLFDPLIGPYQVLPFQTSVNLGAMAMTGALPSDGLMSYPSHSLGEYSSPSSEIQSTSTDLANKLIYQPIGVFPSP